MIHNNGSYKKKGINNFMKSLCYLIIYTFVFTIQNSCSVRNDTSNKYKNITKVSIDVYKSHKTILIDTIRFYITKKIKAYYPKENDSLTQIYIDTILYSPKKDRLAFFVITKNTNDKLLSKGNNNEFNYNATCFISDLNGVELNNIKWLSAYSLRRYASLEESSERIRKIYFTEFKGGEGGVFRYNIDDIRFWDDPNIWSDLRFR